MSFKWVTEQGVIASAYEYESIDANIYYETDNPNIAFSIISGSLPDGVTYTILSGRIRVNGTLKFVPAPTTISFTIRATDGDKIHDSYFQIYIKNLNVAFISPENISTINETEFLNETIELSNPNGTESFSKVNGKLPDGVTLTSHGVLYGTVGSVPSTTVYGFTIRATLNEQGDYIEKYFTITVKSLKDSDAPIWVTSAGVLGSYKKGEKVNIKLTAYDPNDNPYKYVLVTGKLPDGLTLAAATGRITGTLITTYVGTWAFSIGITNNKQRVDRQFSIVTNEINPEYEIVWKTDSNLGTWKSGHRVNFKVEAESPKEYTVSLIMGSLPPGLSIETDGTIYGNIDYLENTPMDYSFTLRAANNYCSVDKVFNVTVASGIAYNNCELALYVNLEYYPQWKDLLGYFNIGDVYKYYDSNYGLSSTPLIYITHDLRTYDRLLLLSLLHFNTPIKIKIGNTYKEERYNITTQETEYDIWYKDIKQLTSNDWTMNTNRPYLNDVIPESPNGNLIDKINDGSAITTQSIMVKDLTVLVEPTDIEGQWKAVTSDDIYTETELTPVEKKYTSTIKYLTYENKKRYIQLATTDMYRMENEDKIAFGVTEDEVYSEEIINRYGSKEVKTIKYFYIDNNEKIYVTKLSVPTYYDINSYELFEDFIPEEVLYDYELDMYYIMRYGDKVQVKKYVEEIKYYQCAIAHISTPEFDVSYWEEIHEATEDINDWVVGHSYQVGDIVRQSNKIYTDVTNYSIKNEFYEIELYKDDISYYVYNGTERKNVIKVGKYDVYWHKIIDQTIAPLTLKYYDVKTDGGLYYYISEEGIMVYLTPVNRDDLWYDYDTKLYYGEISVDELLWDEERQLYYIYDPTAPGMIRYVKNFDVGVYYETETGKVILNIVLFDYINYINYYLDSSKKDDKVLVERAVEHLCFYTDTLEIMSEVLYKDNNALYTSLETNKVKEYEPVITNTWYIVDDMSLLQTVIFYEEGDWKYYYKPNTYDLLDVASIKDIRDRLGEKIYVKPVDTHGWFDKFTQLPINIELTDMEIFREDGKYVYHDELGQSVQIYLEHLRYYRDIAHTELITNTRFFGYGIEYPYFINSDNVLIAVEPYDETMYKFDKTKSSSALLKNLSDGIILPYVTKDIVENDYFMFIDKENEILAPDETDCNNLQNLNSKTGYKPHMKVLYAKPGSNYESLSEINLLEKDGDFFTNKTMVFEYVRLYPKFNNNIPQQDIPIFYFNAKHSPRVLV